MASDGDYQKRWPRLFGVDLTQLYTNSGHADRPVKSFLGEETHANEELGHNEDSTSRSAKSSAQRCKGSVFPCRYCSKKFYDSKALGGHQNAHRIEQTTSKTNFLQNTLATDSFQYPVVGQQPTHALLKTNPFQNSLPTDSFQYPVVGQQPSHALLKTNPFQNSLSTEGFQYPPLVGQQPSNAIFASSGTVSHNFELQRVHLSNYNQPHFEQWPIKLASNILSCAKTNPFQNSLLNDSIQYPVVGQLPTHALFASNGKTNPFLNTLSAYSFQYPAVVGQQPTHPLFASSSRLPHNFDFQRADLSNNQPGFGEFAQNFHVKLASSSLSSTRRARNDMELASRSLPSVKRARTEDPARNEDPEQHNTTPGRMVTLNTADNTEDVEPDLSLHL